MFQSIKKSSTVAWSHEITPMYMALGKLAGTLSEDFDTSGELEIYEFDDASFEMKPVSRVETEEKFYRLSWSEDGQFVAGGMDNGLLNVWRFTDLLNNENNTVHETNIHEGGVKGLDFNKQQPNLLVSGGGKGKIYVWDLANSAKKYNISDKNPAGDAHITCTKWNHLTAPVLASSADNGTVALWDLRKNKSIHDFKEANTLYNSIAWSPVSQTILATASETDGNAVIKIWDLKIAKKPLAVLEGHNDGVLSLSWSTLSPNLLLSAGMDEVVYCWDVESGTAISEVCQTDSWVSSVSWSPRQGMLSVCSDDVKLVAIPDFEEPIVKNGLMQAPEWLVPKSGVSFGFGGQIVSFGGNTVNLSKYQEANELAERACSLTETLSEENNLGDFCASKAEDDNTDLWAYLNIISSSEDARADVIKQLGFDIEDIKNNASEYIGKIEEKKPEVAPVENKGDASNLFDEGDFVEFPDEDEIEYPSEDLSDITFETTDEAEKIITSLLLVGDFATAVDVCFKAGKMPEALILAAKGGKQLLYQTQKRYLKSCNNDFSKVVSVVVDADWENLIKRANIENWKLLLAYCCTYADEPFQSLCNKIGDRISHEAHDYNNAVLCYICGGSIEKAIDIWSQQDIDDLEIIERVVVWSRIIDASPSTKLLNKLASLGEALANNGHLKVALDLLSILPDIENEKGELVNRLRVALGVTKKPTKNVHTPAPSMPIGRGSSSRITPVSVPVTRSTGRQNRGNDRRVPVVSPSPVVNPSVFVPSAPTQQVTAPQVDLSGPPPTRPRQNRERKNRQYQPPVPSSAPIPATNAFIPRGPTGVEQNAPEPIIPKEEPMAPPPKNARAPRSRHRV
eukprot:TRINITY_DN2773_c0_g1_i1.p1 TRINITY_DN2773_c0_g1~~TRINITY_DN2773_c0_g1_i1.p1  ORF type:complete len:852 (+),score=241.08 TRINITY_DN2773_c0_g1_i1:38-2593(+)